MQFLKEVESLVHFDPIQIMIVAAGVIVVWTQLRGSVKWHSDWIAKHDDECHKFKTEIASTLARAVATDEKLTTMLDAHCDRIDRLETWRDKQ